MSDPVSQIDGGTAAVVTPAAQCIPQQPEVEDQAKINVPVPATGVETTVEPPAPAAAQDVTTLAQVPQTGDTGEKVASAPAAEQPPPVLTATEQVKTPETTPAENIEAQVQEAPVNVENAVKVDEVKTDATPNADAAVAPQSDIQTENVQTTATTEENKIEKLKQSGDWQQRECELLKKIEELETVTKAAGDDGLKLELKVRDEEIDLLKARVKNLETELQASLSRPGVKNMEIVESIKKQHEELLSRAKGMIFDKTKVVKNQELQIEALTTQVQSLKDINVITKDLLEIRNAEVKSLEERLEVMEGRFKAEKERFSLVLKRAETSSHINDDLRKEYETQLGIFKELREKYEERVQALVAENNRLKDGLKGGPSAQ